MKLNKIIYSIIIALSITLFSCKGLNKNEISAGITNGRIAVMDRIIGYYDKLIKESFIEQNQQELMSIFAGKLDTVNFINDNLEDFNRQLRVKQMQFNTMKTIYLHFEKLESADDAERTKIDDTLKKCYDNLLTFKEIPDSITKKIAALKPSMDLAVYGKKISYHKDVVYALGKIYFEIWDTEEITVQRIDTIFSRFEKRINKLPSNIFDAQKLREILNQPYSDVEILANMYKVEMVKEINKSKQKINKEIENISAAMLLLIKIDEENKKGEIYNAKLSEYVAELNQLIANFDEKSVINIEQ